jgi:IS605 OrfB family transposase
MPWWVHKPGIQRRSRRVCARHSYCTATKERQPPSNRWRAAIAEVKNANARIAALRRDCIHKLTSRVASEFGTVVLEDLNVAGMTKNRKLSRHIADADFGELRRQLTYKTAWRGGTLVLADRWYPSSKTCSGCGTVKTKLALSERTYTCTNCGLVVDRDLNAARNLAALAGEPKVAASGAETRNGRGADQKTSLARQVAVKRQPGTVSAGQTGTVLLQSRTAANPPRR